jgi:hypothetical protein
MRLFARLHRVLSRGLIWVEVKKRQENQYGMAAGIAAYSWRNRTARLAKGREIAPAFYLLR